MDHQVFDRMAKLLGRASSRRSGLKALSAAVLGHAVLTDPETGLARAGKGRETGPGKDRGKEKDKGRGGGNARPAGPCGNGTLADNRCTTGSECCTGICKLKNKGKKGRCRCVSKGKPCTEDRNCCGSTTCSDGVCGGKPPVPPTPAALIETGAACVPATDTCRDPNATCVAYDSGDPAGTYCLLSRRGECTADADCATQACQNGACIACTHPACREACTPIVCASCTYTTVQDAIDAATSGDVIAIGSGVYRKNLSITGKNLTLRACPGESVTVVNEWASQYSSARRTITVTGGSLDIIGITVAGRSFPESSPGRWGGGIKTDGNLGLYRDTVVSGGYFPKGGGVFVDGDGLTLTITDDVVIEGNQADSYGGGVLVSGESDVMISGGVIIRGNRTDSYGGGVAVDGGCNLTVTGRTQIANNTAKSGGGIGFMNGSASRTATLTISGDVVIRANNGFADSSESTPGGGGITVFGASTANPPAPASVLINERVRIIENQADSYGGGLRAFDASVTIEGEVVVADNQATGGGGGIRFIARRVEDTLTIGGSAVIRNNQAESPYLGGGVEMIGGNMFLNDTASITGNQIINRRGGGVGLTINYNASNLPATLTVAAGASITKNFAYMEGGGVYSDDPLNTLTAPAGTIVDNTSGDPPVTDNCAGYGISC